MEEKKKIVDIVGDFIDCCETIENERDSDLIEHRKLFFADYDLELLQRAKIGYDSDLSAYAKATFEFKIESIVKNRFFSMTRFVKIVSDKYKKADLFGFSDMEGMV